MRRCGLSAPGAQGRGCPTRPVLQAWRRRAQEARLLRGVDEKGDRRLGAQEGGPPLLAVASEPAPASGAAGEAACALTAVVTHAVFRRGGSGKRTQEVLR